LIPFSKLRTVTAANVKVRDGPRHEKRKDPRKAEARELVRQMITECLKPMIKAQIANASGVQQFFLRDPSTGQFKRIADPVEIEAALNAAPRRHRRIGSSVKIPMFKPLRIS
jgi:hypothetical protein